MFEEDQRRFQCAIAAFHDNLQYYFWERDKITKSRCILFLVGGKLCFTNPATFTGT